MKAVINNRYRIMDTLGQGGMGIVYLVEDTLKENMPFALKTIRQDILLRAGKTGINSFKNEYEVMTRLKHPNLTQVYEFGDDGENYFIVMEYLKGTLLSEYSGSRSGSKRIRDILVQILRALEYIHSRNIVYRDIKPSNIMILGNMVKLMDFGLAGFELSKENKIRGTLLYFSPDAVRKDIGYSMDIFSLGLVYYELLTGRAFFDSSIDSTSGIINLLESRQDYNGFLEKRLEAVDDNHAGTIIRRMLKYSPDDRYQVCSAVISDINRYYKDGYEYETPKTRESYVLGNAFADRENEFRELKNQLKDNQNNRLFVYNGDVGTGKTRLFHEFKKYCRLNGIAFFDTSCTEGEVREYHCFCDIILQMITRSSIGLLDRSGPYLKLALPEAGRLKKYSSPEILDNPMMRKEIIVHNLADYIIEFRAELKNRFIIYFNDLQWIDDGSAVILEALLTRLNINSGIDIHIYANINRDRIKSRIIKKMLNNAGIRVEDIGPLNIEGISEYIENIFGARFIDTSIRDSISLISRMVGGNPLFLEEFMKSLLESNIIIKDHSCWKLTKPVTEIEIPGNLIDIAGSRIERLLKDIQKRDILYIMSLVRVDLPADMLMLLLKNITGIEPAKTVTELVRHELLQQYSLEDNMHYCFSTSLIKEIIRKRIKAKTDLHRKIAINMECLPLHFGDYDEEKAYHYSEGKDNDKALFYFRKCAGNAGNNYFHEKAVHYYDLMLYSLDISTVDERLDILTSKARSLETLGRWDEALKALQDCIKTAINHGRTDAQADAESLMGRIYLQRGELKEARLSFDRGVKLAENSGKKRLIVQAYDDYGTYYQHRSLFTRAMEYHLKNSRLCSTPNEKKGYLRAINSIGNIHFAQSRYEEALECFKKCQYLALELGDKKGAANAIGNQGNVYCSRGDIEKALECYGIDRKISEEIGDKRGYGIACGNLGSAFSSLGDYDKALENYDIYLRISREIGDKRGMGTALGNAGSIHYFQGRTDKALDCFKEYRAISEAVKDKDGIKNADLNIGNIYYYLGKHQKALKCYRNSARIAKSTGDKRGMGIASNNIGNIYRELGRYRESLRFFESAGKIFSQVGDKMAQGTADINIGLVYCETGDFNRAVENIKKGRDAFIKSGDRHAMANAFGSLGQVYHLYNHFEKALENFEKVAGLTGEFDIKDPDIARYILWHSDTLLKMGREEEAEKVNKKAVRAADELGNKDFALLVEIQKCRIMSKRALNQALPCYTSLLSQDINDEGKAMIYHDLYLLEGQQEYRAMACRLYQSLNRSRKRQIYRKALMELDCPEESRDGE